MKSLARITYALALFVTFLTAAELTARVEDRIRLGAALTAVPSHDDLLFADESGVRGRPHGRFKKWQLNQFGFRGPEMEMEPAPSCRRVVILGASETFGLYESEGKEYPAQLAEALNASGCGCHEVVNAAITGLTVRSIVSLWDRWVSQFKPAVVVVYPTPAFYLSERAPSEATTSKRVAQPRQEPWWTPRLLERARDVIETPAFIQRRRITQWLAAARAEHPASWLFDTVPEDRLQEFLGDVDTLVRKVALTGARPVLVTHATAFHVPARDEELDELNAWNFFEPRATPSVLLQFEQRAAKGLMELAARHQVAAIDAATTMYGGPGFAQDFIHFTDEGAGVMARLIADQLIADRSAQAPGASAPCSGERAGALQ